MASASIFHLLANPPVADYPDAGTIISATSPFAARLTTMLLDPAVPAAGSAQYSAETDFTAAFASSPNNVIYGRWITRQLPAQTIGAGNWTFYGALAVKTTFNTVTPKLWGFCVAQWRAGTGVVARFLDAPTGGASASNAVADFAGQTVQAGGALTLVQNDQIILEVWSSMAVIANQSVTSALQINGRGQYLTNAYPSLSLTDTDAYLKAPAAITYQ